MPTEITLKEGSCGFKTDCIIYVSFENNGVVRTGSHPEGICIRKGEIAYIEMKHISDLDKIDEVLSGVKNKALSVKINKSEIDISYLDDNYKCIANFLKNKITTDKMEVNFYLVVPNNVKSSILKNLRNLHSVKGLYDNFYVIPCCSGINEESKKDSII